MKVRHRFATVVLPVLLAPALLTIIHSIQYCQFGKQPLGRSLCIVDITTIARETLISTPLQTDKSQSIPSQAVIYKDAIVYLTGADHIYRPERPQCPSLFDSIRSLDRHFPRDNSSNITLIIMSDVGLRSQIRSKLREVSPFPVEFHARVKLAHPELEKNVTDDLLYKRMCAFWFYYFFQLPFLPDYVMRMDTDSCLTSDMPSNPFQAMRQHRLEYMWYSTFHEPGFVIEELRDFVEEHIPLPERNVNYEGLDHNHNVDLLWDFRNDTLGESEPMRVFSTNIEWFHMPAFQRNDIIEWKKLVLENGGVYDHRWGDAPLRTIVATRFFNQSAVGRYCNFSYVHSVWQPFLPCDPSYDIHQWPARKEPRVLENGTTIWTTFGWQQVS